MRYTKKMKRCIYGGKLLKKTRRGLRVSTGSKNILKREKLRNNTKKRHIACKKCEHIREKEKKCSRKYWGKGAFKKCYPLFKDYKTCLHDNGLKSVLATRRCR